MATDGTGLKVIVPKLPSAHNGYIEPYRNREMAVFHYELLLREHRQRFSRPIVDDLIRSIHPIAPALLPSEPLMTAVVFGRPIEQLTPAAFKTDSS